MNTRLQPIQGSRTSCRFCPCLAAAIALLLASCGGGSQESSSPNVTVAIDPTFVTLTLEQTQQFTASVTGSSDKSVIWKVNGMEGGNSTVGTISTAGFYSTPAQVPNPATVTVTAISNANENAVGTAQVALRSNAQVSISPTSVVLALGQQQQFTATVTGSTNTAVTWQVAGVTGGNSTVGTITSAGLYTAPASASTPTAVTVTAISQVDATRSASASVTLRSNISVSVSPNPASVETFGQLQFAATVTGTSNTSVTWQVNGAVGGSAEAGTVSQAGLYTAPNSVPTASVGGSSETTTVTVRAVSQADSTASGAAVVRVFAPNETRQSQPIPLGVSGGNGNDSSRTACCGGTLGALVSRGGKQYILSNNHVLARSDLASVGEPIIHPGLVDVGCQSTAATTVGNLSQFVNLENPTSTATFADAAIAEIVAGAVDPIGTILALGASTSGGQPTNGAPRAGSGIAPAVNLAVAKSGRSTGLTCSVIGAINLTATIEYQKGCGTGATFRATFTNLVDIFGGDFSASGDSGALIVAQNTAEPVALLFAGSDTDTIGSSISAVLTALADSSSGEQPRFVGTTDAHPVAACSLPGPQAAMAVRLAVQKTVLPDEQLQRAANVRDLHASELLAHPQVQALGTGSSLDHPSEPAILFFVVKGTPRAGLPLQVDGIRTRIIETNLLQYRGIVSITESAALEQSAESVPSVLDLPNAEVTRARTVHSTHVDRLMRLTGVQGVGITSSMDSPGEAALMIFVTQGVTHDSIDPVIDGLRTRIRESSPFRAGVRGAAKPATCRARPKSEQNR